MNFLALCQRTREICGVSGTGPASVLNQTGEMLRVVNWVADAWREVQMWQPWGWMVGDFSFTTTANKREYTPADVGLADQLNWHLDTFRCYLTSAGVAGEQFLVDVDYDWYRDVYQFGSMNTRADRPIQFAIKPENQAIVLGPMPDAAGYTIYGKYQKSPHTMSGNADNPDGLQEQYHMMIVYRAAMKYAMYENAPEVLADARSNFQFLLARLQDDWLPDLEIGGPLA